VIAAVVGFAAGPAAAADTSSGAAVGRVNVAGRSFCTGTLIDARRAVTAAHCLFDPRTGAQAPLSDIHFVAGWDRGDFAAHVQPTAVRIAVGYVWERRRTLASLERDLAILEFGRPVATDSLPVEPGARGDGTLALVHYSHRRPHLAERNGSCKRLGALGRLWRLDCPIEPGGSGAPVLIGASDGHRVAAVVIGRARDDAGWTTLALPITSRAVLP